MPVPVADKPSSSFFFFGRPVTFFWIIDFIWFRKEILHSSRCRMKLVTLSIPPSITNRPNMSITELQPQIHVNHTVQGFKQCVSLCVEIILNAFIFKLCSSVASCRNKNHNLQCQADLILFWEKCIYMLHRYAFFHNQITRPDPDCKLILCVNISHTNIW